MNKLPQVLLILTALGFGIITGHQEWKADRQKEQEEFYDRWAKYLEKGDSIVDDTNNWYGDNETGEFLKIPNGVTGIGKHFYGEVTSLKNPPDYEKVLEEEDGVQLKKEQQKEQKKQGHEYENDAQKRPAIKKEETPSYKKELDSIDFLMMEASTYIKIATIDVNLRSEYAKSAYDCTSEALDIFGKFSEETRNSPDFQQRLKTITEVRHAAMKLAPIEK